MSKLRFSPSFSYHVFQINTPCYMLVYSTKGIEISHASVQWAYLNLN